MSSSAANQPPTLSSEQARNLDRLASEQFGVPVAWLMEAAGWQLARLSRGSVAVLCGTGNNGGDGLAAARHLHRWGRLRSVACLDAGRLSGIALAEADALRAAGVEISDRPRLEGADLVVDALFGTGLTRAPESAAASWIEEANASRLPILAVDLPSGLDADTGQTPGTAIRATLTISLGLPKAGLFQGRGPGLSGELWLADIGIPPGAYAALGVPVPDNLFAAGDLVMLRPGP